MSELCAKGLLSLKMEFYRTRVKLMPLPDNTATTKKNPHCLSNADFMLRFKLNRSIGLAVVLLHDLDEVNHLVRVANLIVIPRHNLHELVCEINTSVGVED
jgi:hypothetical protein